MTGAKTDAQMGEAEKHPRGAVTRQAVRFGGGSLAAQALHPSRRRMSERSRAGALDTCARRLVRWPAPSGVALPLHSAKANRRCARPAGARPLI